MQHQPNLTHVFLKFAIMKGGVPSHVHIGELSPARVTSEARATAVCSGSSAEARRGASLLISMPRRPVARPVLLEVSHAPVDGARARDRESWRRETGAAGVGGRMWRAGGLETVAVLEGARAELWTVWRGSRPEWTVLGAGCGGPRPRMGAVDRMWRRGVDGVMGRASAKEKDLPAANHPLPSWEVLTSRSLAKFSPL